MSHYQQRHMKEVQSCGAYYKNLFHFIILETSTLVKLLGTGSGLRYRTNIFRDWWWLLKVRDFFWFAAKLLFTSCPRRSLFLKIYFANEFCNRETCGIWRWKCMWKHHLPVLYFLMWHSLSRGKEALLQLPYPWASYQLREASQSHSLRNVHFISCRLLTQPYCFETSAHPLIKASKVAGTTGEKMINIFSWNWSDYGWVVYKHPVFNCQEVELTSLKDDKFWHGALRFHCHRM